MKIKNKNMFIRLMIYSFILSFLSFYGCGSGKLGASVRDKRYKSKPAKTSNGGKSYKKERASGMMDFETILEKKSSDRSPKIFRGAAGKPYVSGLKAGYVDDNRQFGRFLDFLKKYKNSAKHIPFNVEDRIMLKIADNKGKSIHNTSVKILSKDRLLYSGLSYADGSILFFPSEYPDTGNSFKAIINYKRNKKIVAFTRKGKREIPVRFNFPRTVMQRIPIDILFIFDTTGSMGEEIMRLKKTIEIIHLNLASVTPAPKIRLGMVLYKDKKDSYRTKTVPFTENLDDFKNELNKVKASGGGDYPEDLQAALFDSMKKMKWNKEGIRLAFIITDAPPHLDYGQKYTYKDAALDARKNAVKIFSIGTGGLNINGEYVLRQIAQYTYGRYIFLTYGEKSESEGGRPGSVSHHTGANFQTDKLESIIIRFAKQELSYLTDTPLKDGDPYFEAQKVNFEDKNETLKKLFDMAISQLIDFSAISIPEGTSAAILPITSSKTKPIKLNAEYFTEQLILSLSRNKKFRMVERKNLQKILNELSLSMTGLTDRNNASKVGKIIGAKMLIAGQLYKKKKYYELFLKLLRVETSEILAVTRARIDPNLGL